MDLIFIVLRMKNRDKSVYDKIILKNENIVMNNKRYSINDINTVEAEILKHARIIEYSGNSKTEKTYPYGIIKFIFRTGEVIEFNTLNPIAKLEVLVLKLNILYERLNQPKLYVEESSTYKVIYKRE